MCLPPTASLARKAALSAIVLAGLFSASCSSMQPEKVDAPVGSPVARGAELYKTCAAECHSPEPVRRYPLKDWIADIGPDMTERSKFSAEETHALMAYVNAVWAQPVAKP